MNINKVTPDKHKYLQITSFIDKPPVTLYYCGTLPESRVPTVAIVGTRKPTAYGKEVTHRLAYDLAQQGIIIVSGLALGVDGLAHQAALEAGGTTLAVLPCGLPKIYPARHRDLAAAIVAKGGALITEYTSDDEISYQSNFLERNRIVAGLADAVLITEAAARSGTLNTAAHALAQGKEVFVVPGNITSPMSSGCNALIKQGAHVALSADDIIQVIAPELLRQQSTLPSRGSLRLLNFCSCLFTYSIAYGGLCQIPVAYTSAFMMKMQAGSQIKSPTHGGVMAAGGTQIASGVPSLVPAVSVAYLATRIPLP